MANGEAFWADPPSCAVGEPRKSYRGENSFPLIMQNVHRYFLYLALVFILILGTATAVLILDLLLPIADPRITYGKGG